MPKGSELARAGCPYLGVKYSEMDCQAFVERCLSDIGLRKDLAGSNAWYRYIMQNGWIGSPEECKALFGTIPEGAFLFIHAFDGGEPAKYQNDGIGNASHIGIYTGLSGQEMVDIAVRSGNTRAVNYNFGDGAIHSSSSREAVATSKFSGKTINGGWNRVGLWTAISYGEPIDSIIHGGEHSPEPEPGGETMIATVYSDNGKPVNFRKKPSTSAALVDQIPVGEQVEVTEKGSEWCSCKWKGKTGYIMTQFLIFGEYVPGEDTDPTPIPEGMMLVNRDELEKVYNMIGNLLGGRG
jgi:hypothetical protein